MQLDFLGWLGLNRMNGWHLPGNSRDRQELGYLKTPGTEAELLSWVTVVRGSTGLCNPPWLTASRSELCTDAKKDGCLRRPFILQMRQWNIGEARTTLEVTKLSRGPAAGKNELF